MERMDRARRIGGLVWVLGGVLFQLGWAVFRGVVPGTITLVLVAAVVALATLLLAGPGSALAWGGGWVVALLLALDFAGAVADRFGVFGPPGTPGVSWGDWPQFVDYTQILLGGVALPAALVAAVAATGVEVVLAIALIAGFQRRWTGKAAAGLLTIYLVAMAWTIGLDEVATYALPILVGGALLVSACPVRRRTTNPGDGLAYRGGAVGGHAFSAAVGEN
jgi:hypothetical protein